MEVFVLAKSQPMDVDVRSLHTFPYGNNCRLTRRRCNVGLVDMLPDDALLVIFDLCAGEEEEERLQQVWQTLVHVCRRWRSLVFGSPSSLNLQLICTPRTPARDMLDVWPPLPLVIRSISYPINNVDNIIAVLERRNRVCQIRIEDISSLDLEKVLAAMQQPFPELTHLQLKRQSFGGEPMAVLPDSFLGGSAPHLRELRLHDILFPGVPNLLLSAPHLTDLCVFEISHSAYIPPEVIATVLSTLTSLRVLRLGFQSFLSLPDRPSRRPPPPKRFVLPALIQFGFRGVVEYLDDLMARIDAPLLKKLRITFFNQTLFDTPQLVQFINRTPALKTPEQARLFFTDDAAVLGLSSRGSDYAELNVIFLCKSSNRQVSFLEQVCTSCLPPLSNLEDLYISKYSCYRPNWQDDIENANWLELLQPFTTVKKLYLTKEFVPPIMSSLQELVGERTTEVLPSLQNIFLEGPETSGPVQEGIQQFVATRQASHPIAVSRWDRFRV